jgi:hypothetical protein
MITRADFFAVPKTLRTEAVETPIGTVRVRELTVGDRDRFEVEHTRDSSVSFRSRLIVACACDEAGAPLFQARDVHIIADYPLGFFNSLADAALRISGFSKEDAEALEKKAPTRMNSSSSGSPGTSDGASSSSNGTCPPTSIDAGLPMISQSPFPI